MRESSDEVIIMTDDGSYGRKGLVTEGVEDVIKREKVDKCFCIGPAIYDEIRLFADEEIRNTHRCILEYHHGRRNRNVRRLPYHHRR